MKSCLAKAVHLLAYESRSILMLLLAAVIVSLPVHAQDTLQVDPQHSFARLSLGSETNALEIGLARVSGDVVFDSSNPDDPVVNLKIMPSDGPRVEYAEMTFASQRSVVTAGGKLLVTGDLSITRVERSATIDVNEAYAGPQYGEPKARTDIRQITLVFSDPRRSAARDGVMQLSGTSSVSRETFPELVGGLAPGNWPTMLVDDEKCESPSTFGDDYSGAVCTGTVVATVTNSVVMVGTAGGEDYSGFQPTATPDRKQATMALDLKLKEVSPTSPAAGGMTSSETK
jgi:polyisoprenoid-binding protein YceI